MNDLLVRLTDASFGYRGKRIVQGANLEVAPRDFIGLIGPNGAGKTTLFKGILKLLSPMGGEVWHAPEISRKIGYVPQRDQLDPIYPLTAWDVAAMNILGIQPWYRFRMRPFLGIVDRCLEEVGMLPFRNHPFAQLSGGQRQRVLIARALAIEPKILVLDEPTAGIDPVAEKAVLDLLADLNNRIGMTILMVSHHLQSLRQHVSRVVLVRDHSVLSGDAATMLDPQRLAELLGEVQ